MTDLNEMRKTENNIEIIDKVRQDSAAKKLTAKQVSEKYRKIRQAKNKVTKIFFVTEEDLETIDYNEQPNENIYEGESVLAAVSKVLDFDKFKKEQAEALNKMKNKAFLEESVLAAANKFFDFDRFKQQQSEAIQNFNDQLLEDAETDGKKNKNSKITAKKISEKYKKLRKMLSSKNILPKETPKQQKTDKAALLAAKKISQKYKNVRSRK